MAAKRKRVKKRSVDLLWDFLRAEGKPAINKTFRKFAKAYLAERKAERIGGKGSK